PQITKCRSRRAASMVVRLAMAPGSWARHQERTGRPRPLPFAFVSAFAIRSRRPLPLGPITPQALDAFFPMAGAQVVAFQSWLATLLANTESPPILIQRRPLFTQALVTTSVPLNSITEMVPATCM